MELAEDQWKLDVTKWWHTLQAAQQASYVNTVRGPVEPGFDALRYSPISDYEKTLCANQVVLLTYDIWEHKVLSTAHTSFSIFGLYFTFITGGLIILVSYLLDPIASCLHTRYRRKSYKYLEWTSNTYLQIHRQAEEQFGLGTWQGCTSTIPTINPSNAVLASLDITDLKHPKLRRPSMPVSGLDLDDLCDGGEDGDVESPRSGDNTPTGIEVKGVAYETQVYSLHGSDVSPTCTEVSTSESEVRLTACADTDNRTFHDQAAPRIEASVNRA
ncbi:hypothetical protein PG991_011476 [Apiospora marii]|uniref:Uncharacterized protein n=1 Tax=Apiospora marii TaxID=335849 RepID=A0ABR1REJ4_9PEZI